MKFSRSLLRNVNGSSAMEFALILPLFLIFLFGMIDAGRYIWMVNEAEKATQVGARWAVATDMIPGGGNSDGLLNHNFTDDGVQTGNIVGIGNFPGVYCQASGATPSCTCKSGGTCGFTITASKTDWSSLIGRMQQIDPDLTQANVRIDYDNAGLGYAGDPNGPNVSPLVTVSLHGVQFKPITLVLFNGSLPVPALSYSLTLEDGSGTTSN